MVEEVCHIECYRTDMMVRMGLLNEFQFEMASLCANLASIAVVIDVFRKENQCSIAGTERLELLENPQELWRYLSEIQSGIDFNHRGFHLRNNPV